MYQNGKIYKLVSDLTDNIYIGSTTQPLYKRHHQHIKGFIKGSNKCKSIELLKLGETRIELIENYSCNSKEQLNAREGYYIKLNKNICVNKYIMGRTSKQYREDNKDIIIEKKKQFYEDNKAKITEHNKQYREVNKDKIIEQKKQFYENNKAKIAEQQKQYREANKAKIKEQKKQFYEANKDKKIVVVLD
jgi:hypothetical protein